MKPAPNQTPGRWRKCKICVVLSLFFYSFGSKKKNSNIKSSMMARTYSPNYFGGWDGKITQTQEFYTHLVNKSRLWIQTNKQTTPQTCYSQQSHYWKIVRHHLKHRVELGIMKVYGDCNWASKINSANKKLHEILCPFPPFLSFSYFYNTKNGTQMQHHHWATTSARVEILTPAVSIGFTDSSGPGGSCNSRELGADVL